jgi:rhodanese-related sulfurtransferase
MLLAGLLIIPMISVVGKDNQFETKIKTTSAQEILSVEIKTAPAFFGVNLEISNEGTEIIENIKWSFRTKASISGTGIFMREKLRHGVIDEIPAGEKITIEFRPLSSNTETRSPLGLGNLYMNASAEIEGMKVRTQKRAVLFILALIDFRDTYKDIKPDEAYGKLLNEEFDLIIDVVGLDLYNTGHLPGAVNYVWADGTLNSKLPELEKNWTYLVYCHTDPPSTASAQALIDYGIIDVYRLEGNIGAWREAGYPIET